MMGFYLEVFMDIDEIKANAPDGATHYYWLKTNGANYVRKRKYLIFFTKYESWNSSLELWDGMIGAYKDRLKPL